MSVEIKIPVIGESVTEVTLSAWLKKDGEFVSEGETICEIESDKASMELPAPSSGTLKIMAEAGSELKIGAKIAELDTKALKPEIKQEAKQEPKQETKQETKKEEVNGGKPQEKKEDAPAPSKEASASKIPSPAARKILEEKEVSAEKIEGSGKNGRITKEDALNYKEDQVKTERPSGQVSGGRGRRSEKMTRLRKTIATRLVEAKNTTAMLTTFNEVDMSEIMNLRKKHKEAFLKKHNVNLGYMSFFTKAVTVALREFPSVNAQISGDDIVFFDYADIGIAVSTPKGLVVPVVRSAETKTLADIEKDILNLAGRARDGKITIDEMQGGTFSITNGGIFGSMLSTPIINLPQSAILGMHNIIDRPVALNGQVVIRPMMYLALSYDHRIIDGRESVGFLKMVKELLEEPSRFLLDL